MNTGAITTSALVANTLEVASGVEATGDTQRISVRVSVVERRQTLFEGLSHSLISERPIFQRHIQSQWSPNGCAPLILEAAGLQLERFQNMLGQEGYSPENVLRVFNRDKRETVEKVLALLSTKGIDEFTREFDVCSYLNVLYKELQKFVSVCPSLSEKISFSLALLTSLCEEHHLIPSSQERRAQQADRVVTGATGTVPSSVAVEEGRSGRRSRSPEQRLVCEIENRLQSMLVFSVEDVVTFCQEMNKYSSVLLSTSLAKLCINKLSLFLKNYRVVESSRGYYRCLELIKVFIENVTSSRVLECDLGFASFTGYIKKLVDRYIAKHAHTAARFESLSDASVQEVTWFSGFTFSSMGRRHSSESRRTSVNLGESPVLLSAGESVRYINETRIDDMASLGQYLTAVSSLDFTKNSRLVSLVIDRLKNLEESLIQQCLYASKSVILSLQSLLAVLLSHEKRQEHRTGRSSCVEGIQSLQAEIARSIQSHNVGVMRRMRESEYGSEVVRALEQMIMDSESSLSAVAEAFSSGTSIMLEESTVQAVIQAIKFGMRYCQTSGIVLSDRVLHSIRNTLKEAQRVLPLHSPLRSETRQLLDNVNAILDTRRMGGVGSFGIVLEPGDEESLIKYAGAIILDTHQLLVSFIKSVMVRSHVNSIRLTTAVIKVLSESELSGSLLSLCKQGGESTLQVLRGYLLGILNERDNDTSEGKRETAILLPILSVVRRLVALVDSVLRERTSSGSSAVGGTTQGRREKMASFKISVFRADSKEAVHTGVFVEGTRDIGTGGERRESIKSDKAWGGAPGRDGRVAVEMRGAVGGEERLPLHLRRLSVQEPQYEYEGQRTGMQGRRQVPRRRDSGTERGLEGIAGMLGEVSHSGAPLVAGTGEPSFAPGRVVFIARENEDVAAVPAGDARVVAMFEQNTRMRYSYVHRYIDIRTSANGRSMPVLHKIKVLDPNGYLKRDTWRSVESVPQPRVETLTIPTSPHRGGGMRMNTYSFDSVIEVNRARIRPVREERSPPTAQVGLRRESSRHRNSSRASFLNI
ncbi:MAG: hypothetical protein ACRCV3_05630 [Desulfovibrionaceae bacterium]